MDAGALGLKILGIVFGPAGKWAWKKWGPDPRHKPMIKVACVALARAALDIADEDEFADYEVEALAALVLGALDARLLVTFFETPVRDDEPMSDEEFVEQVLANLDDLDFDFDASILPVRMVLERFVEVLPAHVGVDAMRHQSTLFGVAVISRLDEIHRLLVGGYSIDVHEALYRAAEHLLSGAPQRIPIGLDLMARVHRISAPDAALVFATACGVLQALPACQASIYTEGRIVELVRDLLPTAADGDQVDLDLRHVRLGELDLSGRVIRRLRLDHATIGGHIRLRGLRVLEHASFAGCTADGIVDLTDATFASLSCVDAVFGGLDLAGVVVDSDCALDGIEVDGRISLGTTRPDRGVRAAEFHGEVSAEHSHLSDPSDLGGPTAQGRFSLHGAFTLEPLVLHRAHFLDGLDLADTTVHGSIDIRHCHLFGDLDLRIAHQTALMVEGVRLDTSGAVHRPDWLPVHIDNGADSRLLYDT